MKQSILLALFLASATAVSAADDPVARLHSVRSLRCEFTSSVGTWVRSGHRTVEQTSDKMTAVYDSINVPKGTPRAIGNIGADDLTAWRDAQGNLWMLERTPSGNEIVTTVFPMYPEGTNEFIMLETRHWLAISGKIAVGETAFGTCKILE